MRRALMKIEHLRKGIEGGTSAGWVFRPVEPRCRSSRARTSFQSTGAELGAQARGDGGHSNTARAKQEITVCMGGRAEVPGLVADRAAVGGGGGTG